MTNIVYSHKHNITIILSVVKEHTKLDDNDSRLVDCTIIRPTKVNSSFFIYEEYTIGITIFMINKQK